MAETLKRLLCWFGWHDVRRFRVKTGEAVCVRCYAVVYHFTPGTVPDDA